MAEQSVDVDRRVAETWFRRRGLPMVVRRRLRGVALVQRATPAVVFLMLIDPLLSVLRKLVDVTEQKFEQQLANPVYIIGVLALTLAALVVPPLGGWLVARWTRGMRERGRLIVACVVLVLGVVVLPVVERLTALRERLPRTMLTNLGAVLLILLLTYVGAGALLGWAVRAAVRQVGAVGALASRALPLLMIVVLFSFFSAEVWQLADPAKEMDRERLWLVVGFFALLGALFLRAVVSDEMREIDRGLRTDGPGRLRERLTSTPFTALITDDHVTDRHPLSRGERANVALVFFFAQAMQVVLFAWLVFGFFVIFGALAVTDVVIAEWVGHPRTDGDLFALRLPVSNELIQVSLFLSAFSGLYFAGSAATDPHYRKSFFDPLVADVRVSLAAREAYLARWGDQQRSGNLVV